MKPESGQIRVLYVGRSGVQRTPSSTCMPLCFLLAMEVPGLALRAVATLNRCAIPHAAGTSACASGSGTPRKAAGMTQEAVAKELGKPQSFVSKVETGERRIDPTELEKFAKLYGEAGHLLPEWRLTGLDGRTALKMRRQKGPRSPRDALPICRVALRGQSPRLAAPPGILAGLK